MTLAEAVRQTWPFGGLPIGGVFLGQADGPLLGVARLGGPLGLTLAVYVGGVAWPRWPSAVRAVRDRRRVRRSTARRPGTRPAGARTGHRPRASACPGARPGSGRWSPGGVRDPRRVVAAGLGPSRPDGGPSVGTVSSAAVQGGGPRGFPSPRSTRPVVRAAAGVRHRTAPLEPTGRRTAAGPVARGRGLPRRAAGRLPRGAVARRRWPPPCTPPWSSG